MVDVLKKLWPRRVLPSLACFRPAFPWLNMRAARFTTDAVAQKPCFPIASVANRASPCCGMKIREFKELDPQSSHSSSDLVYRANPL